MKVSSHCLCIPILSIVSFYLSPLKDAEAARRERDVERELKIEMQSKLVRLELAAREAADMCPVLHGQMTLLQEEKHQVRSKSLVTTSVCVCVRPSVCVTHADRPQQVLQALKELELEHSNVTAARSDVAAQNSSLTALNNDLSARNAELSAQLAGAGRTITSLTEAESSAASARAVAVAAALEEKEEGKENARRLKEELAAKDGEMQVMCVCLCFFLCV